MSKRQGTFFDSNAMPPENWAWVVEKRFLAPELDVDPDNPAQWMTVPRPNHFRVEQHAVDRVAELAKDFKDAIKMKLVEFRFSAKYVGYVPPEDETWIK